MSNEDKIEILEDWGDIVAVFKPSGWLTIPGRGNKEQLVLSERLGAQLRGTKRRGESNDLFIIHRLDEGTSGVVLFARTQTAHRELQTLFETREVKKKYWCFVKGTPENQVIDAPLFKLPSKRIKSVVDQKGKPSQTRIISKQSQDGISLVEAFPLTGRSHQIRVHMAYIGFPLLGDKLYGGETSVFGTPLAYPLLHSREISFRWQNKDYEVSAPLEGNFLRVAEGLGFFPSCSIS